MKFQLIRLFWLSWEEYDWIELYNNSNSEINLSNYYLSDDLNNLEKWQLPEIILEPNDFKTFYCSGKNNIDSLDSGFDYYYHTNFKISLNETIILYDGQTILDSTNIFDGLYHGLSIGKSINGNNQWCYFNEPTPNESNNTFMLWRHCW